jgi:hypothetical protein
MKMLGTMIGGVNSRFFSDTSLAQTILKNGRTASVTNPEPAKKSKNRGFGTMLIENQIKWMKLASGDPQGSEKCSAKGGMEYCRS